MQLYKINYFYFLWKYRYIIGIGRYRKTFYRISAKADNGVIGPTLHMTVFNEFISLSGLHLIIMHLSIVWRTLRPPDRVRHNCDMSSAIGGAGVRTSSALVSQNMYAGVRQGAAMSVHVIMS